MCPQRDEGKAYAPLSAFMPFYFFVGKGGFEPPLFILKFQTTVLSLRNLTNKHLCAFKYRYNAKPPTPMWVCYPLHHLPPLFFLSHTYRIRTDDASF